MRFAGYGAGYTMSFSAPNTWDWAHRPNARWPCSSLAGKRIFIVVNNNGLAETRVRGRGDLNIQSDELAAIVADHLPQSHRHLWPCWEKPHESNSD